ncbi:DegT/DnrJ/EryC1/StrS aminotransferase family protein [Geothrix sp. PMB-07]|uniref:DegT/DnrJ/EryC1/StrS family aminotransferase n=1 Tax=Geothrix sp. PMB-07 TaxID=3068640 RepID=UPI002741660A|nr:DegT/DnrJ/EryC1/StrS family aminotransferase [Geothrix sp. PMB-07]WLT31797.1 DegT/DnrJ/EryC1/StrS family aminotransferase [Geothrix sp. PMB-07]
MPIPITRPCFDETEFELVRKPLESGWLVQGPYVAEFERLFGAFTGAPFAKATSNCTTALHLALEGLGIGPGDRVIVPSFTYIASANAVEYTGARVAFCDIDLATFNLDLNQAEALLEADGGRTIRAIMPVHLFGLCVDMPRVMDLARRYQLKVVEDAACGLGARLGGQHAGTFGDAGCFSFHPRKSITTGEGGMVTTADGRLAGTLSSLRDHGAGKSDLQRHQEEGGSLLPGFAARGYNYRMTDLQGALGVAQMGKVARILEARTTLAARYDAALQGCGALSPTLVPPGHVHGYQSYVCLYHGGEAVDQLSLAGVDRLNRRRNTLMARLESLGIATRQGTHAVPTLEYYQARYGLADADFPKAYAADRLSIALPLYVGMTDGEFNLVVESLLNLAKEV